MSWQLLCYSRCQALHQPKQHKSRRRIRRKPAIADLRAKPQSMISTTANAKVPLGTKIPAEIEAVTDHQGKKKVVDEATHGKRTEIGTEKTTVNVSAERSAKNNVKENAKRTANERKIGNVKETVTATITEKAVAIGPIASDF